MSVGFNPVNPVKPEYIKSDSNLSVRQNDQKKTDFEVKGTNLKAVKENPESKNDLVPQNAEEAGVSSSDPRSFEAMDINHSLKKMQRNFLELMRIMHPQDSERPK